MIYFLFLASATVSICLQFYLRYLEYFPAEKISQYRPTNAFIKRVVLRNFFRPADTEIDSLASKLKIAFVRGIVKFFWLFSIVAFFFSGLQAWLTLSDYSNLSQKSVLQIEQVISSIQTRAEIFDKAKFLPEILVLILLIGTAALWPVIEKWKIKERFNTAMKAAGYLLLFLTLAINFTFFGKQLPKGTAAIEGKLTVQKLSLIDRNKDLVQEVYEVVEKRVVQELLEDSTIVSLLNTQEEQIRAAKELTQTDDFRGYSNTPDKNSGSRIAVDIQTVSTWSNTNSKTSIYETSFNQAYQTYTATPERPETANREFKSDLKEARYQDLVEAGIVSEENISEATLHQATATLTALKELPSSKTSSFYERFGEVGEKGIEKLYGYAKDMFNDKIKSLVRDIPFVGEVLEPIHDLIISFITEKCEKVLAFIQSGNKSDALAQINAIGAELRGKIKMKDAAVKDLWSGFRQKVQQMAIKIQAMPGELREAIVQEKIRVEAEKQRIIDLNKRADDNLARLKSESRWQGIRDRFEVKARTNSSLEFPDNSFTKEQWQLFEQASSSWDNYMESHKVEWLGTGVTNLEDYYYQFIRVNPDICAAWGFILQQQDWNAAVEYYSVYGNGTEKGKPYYLLKYYCATAKQGTIDELYTAAVNEAITPLCPD